jgi:hypothetical protein
LPSTATKALNASFIMACVGFIRGGRANSDRPISGISA